MEDLAHFIQSMSEKYGLLDHGSNKHKQEVKNNLHQLQDNSSSAASNNCNSEECQGSSWECLSIFITGSQSIDCKNGPSGPHCLPAVGNSKNYLHAPSTLLQQDSNGTSPLHSFSKMIHIREHQSDSPDDADAGHSLQEKPSSSNQEASSKSVESNEAERGTIYDSCGDLSNVVTMSDYIQQGYFPENGLQPDASSAPPVSKNLGLGQSSMNRDGANCIKTVMQETTRSKVREGVSLKELRGCQAEQQEKSIFDHDKPSTPSCKEQGQQGINRRRNGVVSTSLGLSENEAGFREYHGIAALNEYEISSGRASRDSNAGNVTQAFDNDLAKDKIFEGQRKARSHHTFSNASKPFDVSRSFDSIEEQKDRHLRQGSFGTALDCSISSEVSPDNYLGNHELSTPMASEYLPISNAMQSRVAQLDEASKDLFDTEKFRHSRPSATPLLKSFRETSYSEEERNTGSSRKNSADSENFSFVNLKEEWKPNPSMRMGDKKTSSKNSEIPDRKQSGALLSMDRNGTAESFSLNEAEFLDSSWEQEDNLSLRGMRPGGRAPGKLETREPKWSFINKLLCDNGFSPLDWQLITSSTGIADQFFQTLNDVVQNYARREKVVQELLGEREELRREEDRCTDLLQKLESDNENVKRKLAASEQRAELANAAAEKTYGVLRKDHQRLEASHASILQRCSQLEHACRAKERALRKLQEKIQEAVEREDSQRTKEKELYEKLKHKVAVNQKAQGDVIEINFLLRDLKPATIVGIYERQRAASETRINLLQEENSRLCKELREKENSLLSKMQAISASESDQAGLENREHVILQQLTEIDKLLTRKASHCRKLASRGDPALLPLAVNQKDLKKGVANTKVELKSHSAEEKNLSKHEQQNLQMNNMNGCTNLKCKELVMDICSRLNIADTQIIGAIDGLIKVVAAVPRMETFIEQVCDTVFAEGFAFLHRDSTKDLVPTPETVPSILKSWIEQLQSAAELRQFKESLAIQLWARFDEKAAHKPMSSRVAAASVKDLIETERQYLCSRESYRDGEITLKAEPQKLLHRIISHFQMLFEIPRLEGVMAVMNSVYIQISEYHNFSQALCSILGLPRDSGPNTITSTITSILNKG